MPGYAPDHGGITQGQRSAEPLPNIFELLLASVNIMETNITQSRMGIDKPELIIRPPLGKFRFLEFNRAEEIIAIGYESA